VVEALTKGGKFVLGVGVGDCSCSCDCGGVIWL